MVRFPSIEYASPADKYEGTNGIAAFVGMWYVGKYNVRLNFPKPEPDSTDELFKSSAYLTEAYLLDETSKHSSLLSTTPFNIAFQVKDRIFFRWLEEEGNEMRLKRFGHAMTGTAGWEDGGSDSQADGEETSNRISAAAN